MTPDKPCFIKVEEEKARSLFHCSGCVRPIPPGATIVFVRITQDGEPSQRHFMCGGCTRTPLILGKHSPKEPEHYASQTQVVAEIERAKRSRMPVYERRRKKEPFKIVWTTKQTRFGLWDNDTIQGFDDIPSAMRHLVMWQECGIFALDWFDPTRINSKLMHMEIAISETPIEVPFQTLVSLGRTLDEIVKRFNTGLHYLLYNPNFPKPSAIVELPATLR